MHGIAYLGVSRKLIDPLSQLRYVVQGKEDPVALARQNRVQNVKYFYQGMEMTLYDQVTSFLRPEQLVYGFVAANPTWSDFWDNIVPEPFEAIANGWNNLWFSDDSAFFQQLGSEAVCAAESAAVSAAVGSMATGCLDDVAGAGAKGAAVKYADDVVDVAKPNQVHHYATDKNKIYTQAFRDITDKYGLDLDAAWNKELLPHQGRHPNAYHDFVLDEMRNIDNIAKRNRDIFLELYESEVKSIIRDNPNMLYSDYWKGLKE